jgi:hypothetical protein
MSRDAFVGGIILLFVGIIILIAGVVMQINSAKYNMTTMAEVTGSSCGPGPSPGPSECGSRYIFSVDGQKFEGTSETDIIEKKIKISYNSDDPSLNRVGDTKLSNTPYIVTGVGFGLFIISGLVFAKAFSSPLPPPPQSRYIKNNRTY